MILTIFNNFEIYPIFVAYFYRYLNMERYFRLNHIRSGQVQITKTVGVRVAQSFLLNFKVILMYSI